MKNFNVVLSAQDRAILFGIGWVGLIASIITIAAYVIEHPQMLLN